MATRPFTTVRKGWVIASLLVASGCAETNCLHDTGSASTPETTSTETTYAGTTTSPTGDVGSRVNDVTINVLWGGLRDTPAVGALWIALYSALPDSLPEDLTAEPFLLTSADIDRPDAASGTVLATHRFEDVPVTTDLYYLNIFLDTNGDAEAPVPTAGAGDVWARGGVDGYPAVSAAAKGAEADIALSFFLP